MGKESLFGNAIILFRPEIRIIGNGCNNLSTLFYVRVLRSNPAKHSGGTAVKYTQISINFFPFPTRQIKRNRLHFIISIEIHLIIKCIIIYITESLDNITLNLENLTIRLWNRHLLLDRSGLLTRPVQFPGKS